LIKVVIWLESLKSLFASSGAAEYDLFVSQVPESQ
jgi:hypothetical protein